jgi:hypothetical protein
MAGGPVTSIEQVFATPTLDRIGTKSDSEYREPTRDWPYKKKGNRGGLHGWSAFV